MKSEILKIFCLYFKISVCSVESVGSSMSPFHNLVESLQAYLFHTEMREANDISKI